MIEAAFDGTEQFPLATLVGDDGVDILGPFVEFVLGKADKETTSVQSPAKYGL